MNPDERALILAGFKESDLGWRDPITTCYLPRDRAITRLSTYQHLLAIKGWTETANGYWAHKKHGLTSFSLRSAWTKERLQGQHVGVFLDYQKSVDNTQKSRYPEGDTETKDEVYTGGDKKLTFPHPLIGVLQGAKVRIKPLSDDPFECRVIGASMRHDYSTDTDHLTLIVIGSDTILRLVASGVSIDILPQQ